MSPQNAISILNKQPTILTLFPQLKLCSRCFAFPQSELIFPGKHFPQKILSLQNRARCPKKMQEQIKTRIYRVRNGDEYVMGLQQEVFIDGSSEFRRIVRANGFESALNRSSKWIVAILFAVAIIWRHDAEAMWAALGCTLNAGLSTTLKQILNQERPLSASKSDPGMPSSHAQSIFFTAVFANISVVDFLGMNALTTTMICLIFALASYLSWLRISEQFHTVSQVAVGTIVGSVFAILWFWSWNAIVCDAYLSYLWVRIVVALGAAGYSLAFALYIMRYWVMESIVNFVNIRIKNL